ncbi:putative thiopurine S-methyltransferase [Nitrospina gracilis 3/211]|uniref:Putative thiopurine S-methyltransferase n=1 Tax=Nitrospina gracilis (strain 3/211) TaxID=1266370 RepID=M1YNM1_NITG3|nr:MULTISPECIES: methyltransferase domain-containing protein [Nitrospina]MCF8722006.1 SAM-dependent methyltransferase [Nitrospina sp. Nb-3]CCQ92131.1 putative thiopurine S-methyltransferase [Nitrospina gracilis 3/211]
MSEELEDLTGDGYTHADWQKHYDDNDMPWDLGEVAPPFVRLWEDGRVTKGRMIVPGCGQGHEVKFFAGNGMDVTAVDVAPGAVERLRTHLKNARVDARVVHSDFFSLNGEHDAHYDVFLEQTFFCAIHPDLRSSYVDVACRILKPGGLLIGLFYETGEKGGPPFNTTADDILHHFSERFSIRNLEKCEDSIEKRKGKEWLAILQRP